GRHGWARRHPVGAGVRHLPRAASAPVRWSAGGGFLCRRLPGASPTLGFARAGGTPTAHPCRPGGTSQALEALGEARLPAAAERRDCPQLPAFGEGYALQVVGYCQLARVARRPRLARELLRVGVALAEVGEDKVPYPRVPRDP